METQFNVGYIHLEKSYERVVAVYNDGSELVLYENSHPRRAVTAPDEQGRRDLAMGLFLLASILGLAVAGRRVSSADYSLSAGL